MPGVDELLGLLHFKEVPAANQDCQGEYSYSYADHDPTRDHEIRLEHAQPEGGEDILCLVDERKKPSEVGKITGEAIGGTVPILPDELITVFYSFKFHGILTI